MTESTGHPELSPVPRHDAADLQHLTVSWNRRLPVAVLASLLLHGAILLWLALDLSGGATGAGGAHIDAISVELIDAQALEAITLSLRSDGGATGSLEPSAGSDGAEDKADVAPDAPPPTKLAKHEAPPVEDGVTPVDQLSPEPMRTATPRDDPERDKHPIDEREISPETGNRERQTAQQESSGASAAVSHAVIPSAAADAAAAATAGAAGRYAVRVRIALGRSRPAHRGRVGRVQIAFGLDREGQLRMVRIDRSSGDPIMDRAAIDAVRATRFPAPPAEMSEHQMTFVVPFDFR